MLVTCPNCSAECNVDEIVDSTSCPACGNHLSTRSQQQLDGPTRDLVTRDATGRNVPPSSEFSAREESLGAKVKIGRYVIGSLLGSGGFGNVYLAEDEVLGRKVALKITSARGALYLGDNTPVATDDCVVARLRHPGIVTIYDVGTCDDGSIYVAMEYLSGGTLAKKLESDPNPSTGIAHLIKVADAVHEAHLNGLVHCDLKPSNILLDDRGEPRVVDFGLSVQESEQWYRRGEVSGTPAYMAPEQFRGEVDHFDGRTDIWSLGVILYQILVKRRPFSGDKAQLKDHVLNRSPKPPRQIDDRIPIELEAICLKALAKNVDNRYSTAKDFADALRRCVTPVPAPISTQPPHTQEPVSQSVAPQTVAPQIEPVKLVSLPGGRSFARWPLAVAVLLVGIVAYGGWALVKGRNSGDPRALVDTFAVSNEWVPLLKDRTVVPLVWNSERETDNWNKPANSEKVFVDSHTASFFSLGSTKLPSYTIQCTLGRTRWDNERGDVGLFLGHRPIVTPEGHTGHRCLVIMCESRREGGAFEYMLSLETWDIINATNSPHPVMQIVGHKTITIPSPEPQNVLQVTVREGIVTEVMWQSVRYSELLDPTSPKKVPIDEVTQFGIMNRQGAATFSDVRLKRIDPRE